MGSKPTLREEIANPTVGRQTLHQLNLSNGRYGKRVLKAGNLSSPAGEVYGWITALEETDIDTMTDLSIVPEASQNALDGATIPAGVSVPGYFTDITITSGILLCFANKSIDE